MSDKLLWLKDKLAEVLDDIDAYFKSPRKKALLCVNPDNTEEDILLTDMSFAEIEAALARAKGRQQW